MHSWTTAEQAGADAPQACRPRGQAPLALPGRGGNVPGGCSTAGRCASSAAPGWTTSPLRVWRVRAVRQPVMERAATCWPPPAFAGAVAELFAMGDGRPPEVPGADVDGVTTATLRFRVVPGHPEHHLRARAGSTAPAWRWSLMDCGCRRARAGWPSGRWSRSGRGSRGRGSRCRPGRRWTGPSSTQRAASGTMRGCRSRKRRGHRLACALASSAATGPATAAGGMGRGVWDPLQRKTPVARGRRLT